MFNAETRCFEFVPGPVFANILLADELNRTNPRTQSALLEAMAEGQVTADGATHPLPDPFMVIATQNTQDSAGTFPLPDTELDRFLVRISIGLPGPAEELEIIARAEHGNPTVATVLTVDEVTQMQAVVRNVQASPALREYMVRVAGAGDADALARAAHTLAGAAGVFGATGLVERAAALERAARAGEGPWVA